VLQWLCLKLLLCHGGDGVLTVSLQVDVASENGNHA
jgi:hypothetical protein